MAAWLVYFHNSFLQSSDSTHCYLCLVFCSPPPPAGQVTARLNRPLQEEAKWIPNTRRRSKPLKKHSSKNPLVRIPGFILGFIFIFLAQHSQFATDRRRSKTSGATVRLFHKFNRQKYIWAIQLGDQLAVALAPPEGRTFRVYQSLCEVLYLCWKLSFRGKTLKRQRQKEIYIPVKSLDTMH